MAESAAIVVPVLPELRGHDTTDAWSEARPRLTFPLRLRRAVDRVIDRVLAKFAFHDPDRYRELLERACTLAGEPVPSAEFLRSIRKLDPRGLGVWYLSRCAGAARLTELCRRAVATPGTGPPRPVARSLDRALAGERVCWFGESGGFDALAAATFVVSALAATLAATDLVWFEGKPPWTTALHKLTITANATQAAVRAHRRVAGRTVVAAEESSRLLYQAVNIARRALNHTDLLALDEQLAREAVRLALSAANAACGASVEWMTRTLDDPSKSDTAAARARIAALARSVDALASRMSASIRNESPPVATLDFVLVQSARVLGDAPKPLRPWFIYLPMLPEVRSIGTAGELCERANCLADGSAETLESWATLHDLLSAKTAEEKSAASASIRTAAPVWATSLVRSVTGRSDSRDVLDAIRTLTGPPTKAVPAAVVLAALSTCSLKLRHDLWKLVRDLHASNQERSLAFQLFCRLN
jgi:hypothetical protein